VPHPEVEITGHDRQHLIAHAEVRIDLDGLEQVDARLVE
jgi:hypothetical protein